MTNQIISVGGESPYSVVVGRALLDDIIAAVRPDAKKILVIHPLALATSAEAFVDALRDRGFQAMAAGVEDGESAKRIEVAAFCCVTLSMAVMASLIWSMPALMWCA